MSLPVKGVRSAGFTPPPFVSRGRHDAGLPRPSRRAGRGNWWRGLNGHGKIAVYVSVLLVVALLAALGVSAGSGNGATVQPKVEKEVKGPTLKDLGITINSNLMKIEITLESLRLKMLLSKITALAPQVQSRVLEVSKVVQGARCQGYLAALAPVRDTSRKGKKRSQEYTPDDPQDVWRYAKRVAQLNLPRFQSLLEEAFAVHTALVASAIPQATSPAHQRILEQSGSTYTALRYYIRGLELLTDVNEMTVGQAVELYQKATKIVMGASVSL